MVKGRLILACLLLAGSTLAACSDGISVDFGGDRVGGSGTIVTETRQVDGFDRITLAGEGRVIVTIGESRPLSIETDDNLLGHIETTVRGGTLEIATENGIDIDPTDSVIYRVTMPQLAGLTLSGAGDFQVERVEWADFSVMLSGAGQVDIAELIAESLNVTISGVGGVTIAGSVSSQDVRISGAGSYSGDDLESVSTVVVASGTGSATVWVTGELDATVSGVGSIDYYGSPTVTEKVTGIGSINARGAH